MNGTAKEPLRPVVISFSFDFICWYSISMSSEPVELSRVRFPAKLSKASLGFAQTIKTRKIDRWFDLIGNQGCNRTKGMSFIAMEPHFGCNPDCFDYERNAMQVIQIEKSHFSCPIRFEQPTKFSGPFGFVRCSRFCSLTF